MIPRMKGACRGKTCARVVCAFLYIGEDGNLPSMKQTFVVAWRSVGLLRRLQQLSIRGILPLAMILTGCGCVNEGKPVVRRDVVISGVVEWWSGGAIFCGSAVR
jgi:hypothetical protein